jgi:hypothetical protein
MSPQDQLTVNAQDGAQRMAGDNSLEEEGLFEIFLFHVFLQPQGLWDLHLELSSHIAP